MLAVGSSRLATTLPESPHPIGVEAEDQWIVEEEWAHYLADGIITDEEELADFDLCCCCFWGVCHPISLLMPYLTPLYRQVKGSTNYSTVLPTMFYLFKLRQFRANEVFSSSKETDTLRRSKLSPWMIEMLQILTFTYRSERLDFNNGLRFHGQLNSANPWDMKS